LVANFFFFAGKEGRKEVSGILLYGVRCGLFLSARSFSR